MQQENDGRIFRPSFSIENGEPIDLNCAIKDLLFHCFFPCLGIYAECGGERQYQACNPRDDPICRSRGVHTSPDLLRDFEDNFELDRQAERKTGNADYQPNCHVIAAKDIAEQIRGSVGNPGLVKEVAGGCQEDSEANHARHTIERAQMLFGRGQGAQGRSPNRIAAHFGIQFLPQPAKILRLVIHNREHAAQEEEIACLQRLNVTSERRWSSRKLNAKVLQSALCAARLRAFTSYHRPTCAPSSTGSTSTVT